MAAPTIAAASIKSVENGGSTTASLSPTLSASGNDRIVVIAFVHKDNSTTAAAPSAIVLDSAGVNATLANGKIVQQGTLQLAQEGSFSSTCDVYFCLESNLPTSAGAYTITTTLDSAPQYHMIQVFEVAGCPAQAYDALIQGSDTANVSAGVAFSASITPTVNNCLIVDIWATSHNSAPTFTSTESQMAVTSRTNGGSVTSQFTQTTAAAKSMQQSSSTLHQRRAYTLLSFSGASSNVNVGATKGALIATAKNANVNAENNISSGTKLLSITAFAASVSLAVNVSVNVGSLTLSEKIASVNATTKVDVITFALSLTALNANVITGNNVDASLGLINLTGYNTNVGLDANANVGLGSLNLTALNAGVSIGSNIVVNVGLGSLNLTKYNTTIKVDEDVNVSLGSLSLVGYSTTIKADINVNSGFDALTLTGYSASVSILTTPTPASRTYVLLNESRILGVDNENRNIILTKEDRTKAV